MSQVVLGTPPWKRLIDRTFSSYEVVSIIEAALTSEDAPLVTRDLRGDDSQTFVDVIHEVYSIPPFTTCDLITSTLFGIRTFDPSPPLTRPWISPISHHGSGRSVAMPCVRYAAATLCFRGHSKFHSVTIDRTSRGTRAGTRMCGRVNIEAVRSQSRS